MTAHELTDTTPAPRPRDPAGDATEKVDSGAAGDLQVILQQLSTLRHEVNNHLMAALAETQLLLMDVEDDELRESYEIIQEALRGMRSAVANTGSSKQ